MRQSLSVERYSRTTIRALRGRATIAFGVIWLTVLLIVPGLARAATLQGIVSSGGTALPGYQVDLFASYPATSGPQWVRLGGAITDANGAFSIDHGVWPDAASATAPVLFAEARLGPVLLVTALGQAPNVPANVVINERTTVAAANAFAQFVHGPAITGNDPGLANAAMMAGNLANPETGAVGARLGSSPNGVETATLATFNSLANVVASCVSSAGDCVRLFDATTVQGRPAPENVLEALANLVKNPAFPGYPAAEMDPIFRIAADNASNQPALTARPTSWLLFLKITGGYYSLQASTNLMNGPGNFAIDSHGDVWLDDNYQPRPEGQFACAGRRVLKFLPSGDNYPGSPFFGGGVNGAGFGITLDQQDRVWIGNFGFQDPPCANTPEAATTDSVSVFAPDGTALTGPRGFTKGGIDYPQGMGSDRSGNVWVANCSKDTVTRIPVAARNQANNYPLVPDASASGRLKPFGLAVGRDGTVWVANNASGTVSILANDGSLLDTLPAMVDGKAMQSHPIGIAADTKGNMWIANSDWVDAPCPTTDQAALGPATNPSISLYDADTHQPFPGSPFSGGGLTLPWGIAVDGDDTVWVFNFGAAPIGTPSNAVTSVARFCGADVSKCPAGLKTGDPISPSTGYQSDAFMRTTGGQIDPSGNIWMTDNWKIHVNPDRNPGGNAIVIAVGAAKPLKTPLIGPPVPFE
jgi:sugar lactone lactonase YvrE